MESVLTISNNIHFKPELNTHLGFTNTDYSERNHKSEKPVMITTTDKVHLKCDCVDGSIAIGNKLFFKNGNNFNFFQFNRTPWIQN